ncbi:MAG: 5-formyltetrahydrofolate cyclo-ligase [Colwellia sp.]|nr:5-formyltetrahydrofolate cyclo-ligase [Colwellia sp.]
MPLRKHLRKEIRKRRNNLTTLEQLTAAKQLKHRLAAHKKIKPANHIAVYLANDGELDPCDFITWCWQQGKKVYLPVIHPFSKGHLLFLNYTKNSIMVINRYGILEPKLDVRSIRTIDNIDVLCTPLVAFDETGSRLGMGGGFYDRTLEAWYKNFKTNHQIPPYPIGIAHNCQRVDIIPSEHWDIPLPEIITPTKNY